MFVAKAVPQFALPPLTPAVSSASVIELERLARVPGRQISETSTVAAFAQTLRRIEDWYQVADAPAVRRFLYQNRVLADVLVEAFPRVQEFFGPQAQMVLRVVPDREVENDEQLFAYILTSQPPDEAMRRLDALDEAWFLDQLDRVGGLFNFDLEFV